MQASSDARQEMISIIIVMMMMTMLMIKRNDEGEMNKYPFGSILGCRFGLDDENTATMMKMVVVALIRTWCIILLPVKMTV